MIVEWTFMIGWQIEILSSPFDNQFEEKAVQHC